ncbi:MAG: PepSY-associated TM helix domain-containing protein [Pseudomonadota bacterium]
MKTFTDVHTWTGLGAGLALFIAFYAGALTVFHHELYEWDSWSPDSVSAQHYDEAQQLIDMAVATNPAVVENLRVELSGRSEPQHLVRSFKRKEEGGFERFEYRLTDDRTLDTSLENAHLSSFVYRLHYTAGIPNVQRIGMYTLGFICVLYGLALVSGVVIFLPNFLRDLFIVRKGKNLKRFWLDAHNVIGMLSLPWHIMFAWSSALLAIGALMLAPFQFLVFEEDLLALAGPELGVVQSEGPSGISGAPLSVSELIANAKDAAPAMEPNYLRYEHYGDSNGRVTLYGPVDSDTLLSFATVTLNSHTGELLALSEPDTASAGYTFYRGMFTLHFADFGGDLVRWVYFLLSMAGAFLFYSGNLLWVEARRRRRSPEQPGNAVFLARLNSGVCVGCMAGISAAFVGSRLLMEHADRIALTEWVYYAVFLASVGWTLWRPVASGARELLWLCAGLTMAIPLADAWVLGMPPWRSLMQGEWVLFTVQTLAIVFALAFLQMAQAVKRRAEKGPRNSVWSELRQEEDTAGLAVPIDAAAKTGTML